ncbi:hypothetical protein Bca4012_019740 [Brassica carinata]
MDSLSSPTLQAKRPRRQKRPTSGEAGDGLGVRNILKRRKMSGVERPEESTEEYVTAQSERGGVPVAPEQIEIKVPNDKVDVIIGRDGKNINNMQRKSRAQIQLIPPEEEEEGDGSSKERTVRISGDKRQIDIASKLLKEAFFQGFTLEVTESNTALDRVCVSKTFTDQGGLKKENHAILLMNKKGTTACDGQLVWTVTGCFIKSGWTEVDMWVFDASLSNFFKAFKLLKIMNLLQHIPRKFTKGNKLKPGEIILLDKDGATYKMMLEAKREQGHKYLQIKDPIVWENFCLANGVKAGESLTLELTERRELKFFSKDDNEIAADIDPQTAGYDLSPPFVEEQQSVGVERTLPGSLNEKDPNLDEQVSNSQTSEFCSRSPVHPSPPPRPREMSHFDKDVVLTNRTMRDWVEDVCNTLPDVEAEHTAKNSELTSSFLLFSEPFQLELEKLEIRNNYEEENSLLIPEIKRRRAEVHEEFKRKHDDIEAECTAN